MTEKLLFTGKIHNTNGPAGSARSTDGRLDVKLPAPHPAAEQLFGAAWSACYMGAIELAAAQRKIKLPDGLAVDAEIDLDLAGSAFFLRASQCQRTGRRARSGAGPDRNRAHDLPLL
jgi:organic hydroperoxide reductase OsmC/OhrA